MFTQPVGHFQRQTTEYRPSSNTPSVTGTGAVTNPANAYDADGASYAIVSCPNGDASTASVIYSGLGSATLNSPNLYIRMSGTGTETVAKIEVSLDSGATYPFQLSYDSTYAIIEGGGYSYYVYSWPNLAYGLAIMGPVSVANVRVRISVLSADKTLADWYKYATVNVYDIYMTQ